MNSRTSRISHGEPMNESIHMSSIPLNTLHCTYPLVSNTLLLPSLHLPAPPSLGEGAPSLMCRRVASRCFCTMHVASGGHQLVIAVLCALAVFLARDTDVSSLLRLHRDQRHDTSMAWVPHEWGEASEICFGPLTAWVPCEDRTDCEYKAEFNHSCRERTFYDTLGWDSCDPTARLQRHVYVMHPPLHLAPDWPLWEETTTGNISLPLKLTWVPRDTTSWPSSKNRELQRVSRDTATLSISSSTHEMSRLRVADANLDTGDERPFSLSRCPPLQRRAIVGFAAKFMRPWQIVPVLLSALRSFPRTSDTAPHCTRFHMFVSDPNAPLMLHYRALGTPGWSRERVFNMTPEELATAEQQGELRDSFFQIEDFNKWQTPGNNRRVEVVRINVMKQWIRSGRGPLYREIIAVDARDTLFAGDIFKRMHQQLNASIEALFAVNTTTAWSSTSSRDEPPPPSPPSPPPDDLLPEYVYAVTEEFPFFRHPGEGLTWNMKVHSTVYGVKMTNVLQSFHLIDFPYYRLINSGVYGGTYHAMLDLLDVWGSSVTAVFSETFGVDQPLLGGLFYVGLRMMRYPHAVFLVSGSDGPVRHLYSDGGSDPLFPHMRLRLPDGTLLRSREWMLRYAHVPINQDPVVDDAGRPLWVDGVEQLNCNGEPYAIVHQSDRYPVVWKGLTVPISNASLEWGKRHQVEITWLPRKPRRRRARGLGQQPVLQQVKR